MTKEELCKEISDKIDKYCSQYKVDRYANPLDIVRGECLQNGATCPSLCTFGDMNDDAVCILKRALEILESD